MIKRIKYGSIQLFFWTLLLLALSVSGLRFALAELNLFKIEIESQLSQHLGAQVNIAKIRGALNVFKPELTFHGIKIQSQQQQEAALQLKAIHLGVDLLTSLERPLLESLQITIVGAKLSVKRLKSGSIAIQGLPSTEDQQNPSWLMQGKQYKLIDSEINWHDEKRNAQAIQLKHVNISIHNKDHRHKIFITSDLPESLGQSLSLAMDFTGDMFVPDSVNARLFVQGKDIKLAKVITGDLPFDFTITKGQGDFSLWSTWEAAQMIKMSGNVLMSGTEINNELNNHFPIDQLELQFELQKKQQQWQLGIQNGLLNTQQVSLDISRFAVALEQNEDGDLIQVALNCPQLNLGNLNKIITRNKILPEEIHRHLQELAIEGQVKNLLFLAKPLEKTFAVSGQLSQLHSKSTQDFPGIDGLSLYIKGTEQQGDIQVSSQQLTFNSPSIFREPLYLTHTLGELHWQQQADNWLISSPMLELQTADIKSKNKFKFTLPKSGQSPFLSLQSYYYDGHDAAQIPHYLPAGIIEDKSLLKWLDYAFLTGKVDQGGLLFHGTINDYPFTKSNGVFESLFNAKNVDLHYADNWHLVENLAAEVRFFSESLEVKIHSGIANQAKIKQATVKINSFANSDTLSIKGDINGNLTQAIGFLKQTSYKEQITTLDKLLGMQGPFSANINLEVPLTDFPAKINITATPQNALLNIAAADLLFTDINGQLHITEKGIISENLTAHTLGFPIAATISSQEQNTSILLAGKADIEHLATQFPSQLWTYFTGTSDYIVRFNTLGTTSKNTELQISTDLEGIAIDFSSLSKSKVQVHPLSLGLSMDTSGINALNINYKNSSTPENNLDLKLKKILPHWQGLFHSPFASGSIFIPVDFNKDSEISLFCETLNLSGLDNIKSNTEKVSFSSHDFPRINLESQALYWQNYNLGKLKLLTQASPNGLFIKQLNIVSPTDTLDLSGYWQQTKSSNKTLINGTLLSEDFGRLLQRLQLSENIVDSTAEFQFSFNWPGTPSKISRKTISGTVTSHLTNGRILGVEPGLGRVLGALDTQKLFKRLLFDFSDIIQEGLSFSEITVDTSLDQGLVTTKNFYMNAMPAKINLTGTANLNTRQIDLLATVLPKFPIAGTIIGTVANAVTKTVTGKQLAGGLILSLLYEIKGTWEHPEVNRQFNPVLRGQTLIP